MPELKDQAREPEPEVRAPAWSWSMARSSGLDEVRPAVTPEVTTERRLGVRFEAARSGSARERVPAVDREVLVSVRRGEVEVLAAVMTGASLEPAMVTVTV